MEAGHSRINNRVVQAIARDITIEIPDFVLVAGDMVKGEYHNSKYH